MAALFPGLEDCVEKLEDEPSTQPFASAERGRLNMHSRLDSGER